MSAPAARVVQLTRLRSTKDLIDRTLAEQLDVQRLAAHAGYSDTYEVRVRAAEAAVG